MKSTPLLIVDGAVETPLALSYADLEGFAESDQVADVSRFQPTRAGDGVTLDALLRLANPLDGANFITLHAGRDDFHVSIPLGPIREEGVVVYRMGGNPFGPEKGGPVRLIIRNPANCHAGELDECANVKYLDRIEVTTKKGRDTRPLDESEHEALHRAQGAG